MMRIICEFILCLLIAQASAVEALGQTRGPISTRQTDTRPEVRKLIGHRDWLKVVAFSRQRNVLASGGFDSTVRLWDAVSGKTIKTFPRPKSPNHAVQALQFSPDGKTLAVGSHYVQLWDIASGRLRRTLMAKDDGKSWSVNSVAFSPDGNLLATATTDLLHAKVRLWDVRTGSWLRTLASSIWAHHVLFSPNGATLAIASGGRIELINVKTKERQRVLHVPGTQFEVESLSFSPDGKLLVVGGDRTPYTENWSVFDMGGFTGEVHLWDLQTGRLLKTIGQKDERVFSVAFSPNGKSLAVSRTDGTRIWNLRNWQLRQSTGTYGVAADFSSDGKMLAMAFDDTPVIWQVRDWDRGRLGAEVRTAELPQAAWESVPSKYHMGAMVMAVGKGSPASRAGLLKGDIVVSVAGRPVESAEQLVHHIRSLRNGDVARMVVWRSKQLVSMDVTLATDE